MSVHSFAVNHHFEGPCGCLEALVQPPQDDQSAVADRPVAVICHPHPQYGGSLHNKVVYGVAKTLRQAGFTAFRFNFRGVGASEGIFDNGIGELEDLRAAQREATRLFPGSRQILCGYSFGAWVSYQQAIAAKADTWIGIAPPLNIYQFPTENRLENASLTIVGDADHFCGDSQWQAWKEFHSPPMSCIRLAAADHFFSGQIGALKYVLASWLTEYSGAQ